MPGFLRRKTPLSRTLSVPSASERRSSDVAPSLPPLLISSLAEPVQLPPIPKLDDAFDPWKVFDVDSTPSPARTHHKSPSDSIVRSVDIPNLCSNTVACSSPVATGRHQNSRQTSTRQVQAQATPTPLGNQSLARKPLAPPLPLSPPPPPPSSPPAPARPSTSSAAVRGQAAPASSFDFEESLSAANVTSVVHQFRSYPPPIRHHPSPATPSQMAIQHPSTSIAHRNYPSPQKPESRAMPSSTTHPTDATRRTDGSYGTSTSASPASEVIDQGRLDPTAPCNASLPSVDVASRSNVRAHPPTSYSARTLARQNSHSSQTQSPMLFDMLRSGNQDLRKGPLIFAAMTATQQTPVVSRNVNPYPSPPAEYASSPSRRNGSVSSASRGAFQAGPVISPSQHATELPPLTHKSSRSSLKRAGVERTPSAGSRNEDRPRVLTKARPTTPQRTGASPCQKVLPQPGDPLLLDDDPFARVGGVRMLNSRPSCSSGSLRSKDDFSSSEDGHVRMASTSVPKTPSTPDDVPSSFPGQPPLTPASPDDYKAARQQRRGQWLEKVPPPAVAEAIAKQLSEEEEVEEQPREPTPPPTYFPIIAMLSDASLLPLLLSCLSYSEWLALYSANKQVRDLFPSRILREFVLERYLGTVGYSKWDYEWAEPVELSLKDLHNYLRGVAMPAHQYARLAATYLHPQMASRDATSTSDAPDILSLALTTRAYTRVILRLRAQSDSEARYLKAVWSAESSPVTNSSRPDTRQHSISSRAPSPTSSSSHGKNDRSPSTLSPGVAKFKSPLYRPGRAPVLRVFVPSPEGDWLSDASVMECEAELKRSGVLKLLRVGDIVWDVAVGDEGNLGRLMWDGSYLVDLDYRYSRMGELSPYFHSLAFAPSYFHRVIRIGGSSAHNPHCNPIVYIDVSPWGQEIATNLQLLQDRARTETPHGALHDVVRWVHRSTFTIRPPVPPAPGQTQTRSSSSRVPIPNVKGFHIDAGWYGTVVLESEGTNEGLADLQARCGPGVFPPRAETIATKLRNEKEKESKRVWRILREKSRPGEIWLRAVQVRERMM